MSAKIEFVEVTGREMVENGKIAFNCPFDWEAVPTLIVNTAHDDGIYRFICFQCGAAGRAAYSEHDGTRIFGLSADTYFKGISSAKEAMNKYGLTKGNHV